MSFCTLVFPKFYVVPLRFLKFYFLPWHFRNFLLYPLVFEILPHALDILKFFTICTMVVVVTVLFILLISCSFCDGSSLSVVFLLLVPLFLLCFYLLLASSLHLSGGHLHLPALSVGCLSLLVGRLCPSAVAVHRSSSSMVMSVRRQPNRLLVISGVSRGNHSAMSWPMLSFSAMQGLSFDLCSDMSLSGPLSVRPLLSLLSLRRLSLGPLSAQ